MALWNMRDLCSPPINSVKMQRGAVDTVHLKSVLHDATKILKEKYMLHREAAVLSRYLYKEKRRFSGHKGLSYMAKVCQGLKHYLSLDLLQVYSNCDMLLSHDETDECVYVPTRQILEYLLLRTQGFSKIMYHVANSCQIAAHHCREILRIGHLLHELFMGYSMISRIWYCSRYYITCACQWYSQLLPYLEKLKLSGISWLPDGYKFPSDLKKWLGPDVLTGEIMNLSCNADVTLISEDISKCEEKDFGVPLNRYLLTTVRNTKCMTKDKHIQNIGYNTKYDKLLMTASNNLLETCDVDPKRETSSDLGEVISRDQLSSLYRSTGNTVKFAGIIDRYKHKYNFSGKKLQHPLKSNNLKPTAALKNELSSTKYNGDNLDDYGETISREWFSSQSDRGNKVSSISKSTADINLSSKTPLKSCSSISDMSLKRENRKRKHRECKLNNCREVSTYDESPTSALSVESRFFPLKKRESTRNVECASESRIPLKRTRVRTVEAEDN